MALYEYIACVAAAAAAFYPTIYVVVYEALLCVRSRCECAFMCVLWIEKYIHGVVLLGYCYRKYPLPYTWIYEA